MVGSFQTREEVQAAREKKAKEDAAEAARQLAVQIAAVMRIQSRFRGKVARNRMQKQIEEVRRQREEERLIKAKEDAEVEKKKQEDIAAKKERQKKHRKIAASAHDQRRKSFLGEESADDYELLPIDPELQNELDRKVTEVQC